MAKDDPLLVFLRKLRRFLPAHWGQFLLLAGILLLYCAPFLGWDPPSPDWAQTDFTRPADEFFRWWGDGDGQVGQRCWQILIRLSVLPVFLASLLGLWLAFRPPKKGKVWLWEAVIVLPLGVVFLVLLLILQFKPLFSAIESPIDLWSFIRQLDSGIVFASLGALFVFSGRWIFRTPEPVRFKGSEIAVSTAGNHSQGCDSLRYVVLVLTATGLVAMVIESLFPPVDPWSPTVQRTLLDEFLALALGVVATALPAVGVLVVSDKRTEYGILRMLKFRRKRYLGAALAIPLALVALVPLASYLLDKLVAWHMEASIPSQWSALGFAPIPLWLYGSNLMNFPAALLEEIGWRGFLQPRLIERFGLHRGVFLVGLVWGVYHFSSDLGTGLTGGQALEQVLERLMACVAYSAVLSWIVLRSGTILPAVFMHGALNYYPQFSPLRYYPYYSLVSPIALGLVWGLCAFLLYRFWPVKLEARVRFSSA